VDVHAGAPLQPGFRQVRSGTGFGVFQTANT
jgi:hypothetical protein